MCRYYCICDVMMIMIHIHIQFDVYIRETHHSFLDQLNFPLNSNILTQHVLSLLLYPPNQNESIISLLSNARVKKTH